LGLSAYVEAQWLHRLAGGPAVVSGAHLSIASDDHHAVSALLKNVPIVAGVASPASVLESFEKQLGQGLYIAIGFLLGFASVIAVGVVYNGARISLSERERELVSLRVMGFRRNEVALLLLGEQAVVTLLAVTVGWGLGYVMSLGVAAAIQSDTYRLRFVANAQTYVLAASFVAGLTTSTLSVS
jgi:putative ABC transport system permease protein